MLKVTNQQNVKHQQAKIPKRILYVFFYFWNEFKNIKVIKPYFLFSLWVVLIKLNQTSFPT